VHTTAFNRPSSNAHVAVEAAVVQRDGTRQLRRDVQQVVVPDLALRAGVGEDERAGALLDDGQQPVRQLQPQVPGPRVAFHFLGDDAADLDGLADGAAH
jgi:hypothetical protein